MRGGKLQFNKYYINKQGVIYGLEPWPTIRRGDYGYGLSYTLTLVDTFGNAIIDETGKKNQVPVQLSEFGNDSDCPRRVINHKPGKICKYDNENFKVNSSDDIENFKVNSSDE